MVTRVHYFNDILIGFVAAIFVTRVGYLYRFNVHYWILYWYSNILGSITCFGKPDVQVNEGSTGFNEMNLVATRRKGSVV